MNRKAIIERFACAAALAGALASAPAAHAFEPEQITIEKLDPGAPDRLFVTDVALSHIADGKVFLIDGAKMKMDGVLSMGMFGMFTPSNDRRELYTVTTYYSRLWRGERTDTFEIWDASTLLQKAEILIPTKHAQALPYRGLVRTSADGRYALIQNATPASSVTIVDIAERKAIGEIPTPGCWTVMPSAAEARRFSTLCGDGTLMTIAFDEAGKAVARRRSEKFFDADRDPVFAPSQNIGDRYVFLSFRGMVHEADLSGEVARFAAPWPMVTSGADRKAAWRPGGYQFFAVHADSRRLYAGMHPDGKEGTHKFPAKEIWAFDLDTHKRVARLPGANAVAVTVTQGSAPKLFALGGDGTLSRIALEGRPRVTASLPAVVEFPSAVFGAQ